MSRRKIQHRRRFAGATASIVGAFSPAISTGRTKLVTRTSRGIERSLNGIRTGRPVTVAIKERKLDLITAQCQAGV